MEVKYGWNDITTFVHFNSVADAVDYRLSGTAPVNESNAGLISCEFNWSGSFVTREWLDNRDETWLRRQAQQASPDVLDVINSFVGEVSTFMPDMKTQQKRRRRLRGEAFGEEIDADKFLARTPEMWERTVRVAQPSRTITIGVEWSISAGQRRHDLLYRGAAAAALADWLSRNGYSVGISAVFRADRQDITNKGANIASLNIKSPNMPLDIGSCATAMCEVAFVRGVMLYATMNNTRGRVGGSMGCPKPLSAEQKTLFGFDVMVPMGITSEEAALKFVREQAAQISGQVTT